MSIRTTLGSLLSVAFVMTLMGGCASQPDYPPEKKAFIAKYKQLTNEMSQSGVEKTFEGYHFWSDEGSWEHAGLGSSLVRPATRRMTIGETANATEYDWYICVYFDARGKVVGKELGEICK